MNIKTFLFLSYLFIIIHSTIVYDWKKIDRDPQKWIDNAHQTIETILDRKRNNNVAKNLILFLGDGMGISTITAGRIYKGQKKNQSGEEEVTYMESLGNVALSKVS
jgi:alkaline phosphatase